MPFMVSKQMWFPSPKRQISQRSQRRDGHTGETSLQSDVEVSMTPGLSGRRVIILNRQQNPVLAISKVVNFFREQRGEAGFVWVRRWIFSTNNSRVFPFPLSPQSDVKRLDFLGRHVDTLHPRPRQARALSLETRSPRRRGSWVV